MPKLAIAKKDRPNVLTLLRETRAYIARNPGTWIQNDFANTNDGQSCGALSPEAKRFCALGYARNRAGDLFGTRSVTAGGRTDYYLGTVAGRVMDAAEEALDAAAKVVVGEDSPGIIELNDGDWELGDGSLLVGSRAKVLRAYKTAIELVADLG